MTGPHADVEVIDLHQTAASRAATPPPGRGRRSGGADRGRLVVAVLAVLALGWLAVVAVSLWTVRSTLGDAAQVLEDARDRAADGALGDAADLVASARADLDRAAARLAGPTVWPASALPPVRDDIAASRVIAGATGDVAAALESVLEVLVGDGGEGLSRLAPVDGRVPVDVIDDAHGPLADAVHAVDRAIEEVREVDPSGLVSPVAQARADLVAQLAPLRGQLAAAAAATDVLPSAMGADAPRRWMVLASNPTESRGSGGFYGAFTVMTVDDGVVEFGPVQPIQDLPILPVGTIPWFDDSLGERYDRYGGSGFALNVGFTPHFPAAAAALADLHAASGEPPVDGVIAVDPYAFAALLEVAGPVEVPGIGEVGADDVVEFVTRTAYTEFQDEEVRKRLIGEVAAAALTGFLAAPDGGSPQAVGAALAEVARRGSIDVWSDDPEEQAQLEALGLAGDVLGEPRGDVLAVTLNSGAPYKVDYWLSRRIAYDVSLTEGGTAAATLAVGLRNAAPTSGEDPYMIGRGVEPLDVGDVLTLVSAYCAPGCEVVDAIEEGYDDLPAEEGQELGYSVSSLWLRLPAGREQQLIWALTTPGAWEVRGDGAVYRLRYAHQPTIQPTEVEVVVTAPEGYRPAADQPEGAVVDGDIVTVTWEAVGDVEIEVPFVADGG